MRVIYKGVNRSVVKHASGEVNPTGMQTRHCIDDLTFCLTLVFDSIENRLDHH